jgi:hypothetical protein
MSKTGTTTQLVIATSVAFAKYENGQCSHCVHELQGDVVLSRDMVRLSSNKNSPRDTPRGKADLRYRDSDFQSPTRGRTSSI